MSVRFVAASESARLSGAALIDRLLDAEILVEAAWGAMPAFDRDELLREADGRRQLEMLVARRLLTPFQAEHLGRSGSPTGLVCGNYRLREPLGKNAAGLFLAEHRRLKSTVAIQVSRGSFSAGALRHFFDEVHVLMTCRHPGLGKVLDAGEEMGSGPYVVLEMLAGQTLGDWVRERGPLPVARACQVAHQVADALTEAHSHGVFHRQLNPNTVFITPEGHAKVIHFGTSWLVPPGKAMAGYIAPELSADPHRADPRCDLFSLAATLLFTLTGRPPFAPFGTRGAEEIPGELTALLNRLTDPNPAERIPSASAVLRALAPFLGWHHPAEGGAPRAEVEPPAPEKIAAKPTSVLIVDDEFHIRQIVRLSLAKYGLQIVEADNGEDAVKLLTEHPFDLVLLDMDLPKLSGAEVLNRIRENPAAPHLKVIVLSGQGDGDHLSGTIFAGADDFLTKPFSIVQLRARVTAALRLKQAQDHSELLALRLASANAELELAFNARGGELVHARGALVLALAKLVEQRSSETGPHLLRLQRYSRVLGEAAAATATFAARLSPEMLQTIQQAAPLHDIGKVAVPDLILNKPGALTPEERLQIQGHAAAGADTLAFVTERFPFAAGFFSTAIEIARHHHEKWDGSGYPGQLAGEAIPLSARLVAVGDVYDALRSRRIYKAGEDHAGAVHRMTELMPGHFDPRLLELFAKHHEQFREVFDEFAD